MVTQTPASVGYWSRPKVTSFTPPPPPQRIMRPAASEARAGLTAARWGETASQHRQPRVLLNTASLGRLLWRPPVGASLPFTSLRRSDLRLENRAPVAGEAILGETQG